MKNNFFNLPAEEQLAWIRRAGDKLDIPDIIIEKDLWICWLLEKLFELPVKMVFKGGTSLSKVFNLIKRFSEDCDITIDYRNFQKELDLDKISNTQLKKISKKLKEQLKVYVSKTVLSHLNKKIAEDFPKKKFELTLSEDGEQLRLYYPSIVNTPHDYLRDHVLIEFGVRNSTDPCEALRVVPYLAEVTGEDIDLPRPMINTLSPLRTFWEKATLIHAECHRDRWINSPERLSRHWYDLCMLYNSRVGEEALANNEILQNVIEYKKAFYNAPYAHFDDCLTGKFRLTPSIANLENLQKDFSRMMDAEMFHEAPPSFEKIKNTLQDLEKIINQKNWNG